jgi:hypothetical protein
LQATIVANNDAEDSDTDNIAGSIHDSLGHNLFNDDPAGDNGDGDLNDKPVCFGNFDNNGGQTDTLPPVSCTTEAPWAVDWGPSSGPSDDQRELSRPVNTYTDIGAYECQEDPCETEPPAIPSYDGPGFDVRFVGVSENVSNSADTVSTRDETLVLESNPESTATLANAFGRHDRTSTGWTLAGRARAPVLALWADPLRIGLE